MVSGRNPNAYVSSVWQGYPLGALTSIREANSTAAWREAIETQVEARVVHETACSEVRSRWVAIVRRQNLAPTNHDSEGCWTILYANQSVVEPRSNGSELMSGAVSFP